MQDAATEILYRLVLTSSIPKPVLGRAYLNRKVRGSPVLAQQQ